MVTGTNNGQASGVINLSKGGRINLSKQAPGLKKIMFGLGWDTNKYDGGEDFDLDASVFLVDKNNKSKPEWFIFYNNLIGPNESVKHMGDNRTGDGDGDDEQIFVDLDKVPDEVDKIAITVTIDSADQRNQNFGMVDNAYCHLLNTEDNDKEVIHFDLGEDFSIETAIVVGELYRNNGDWKFNAIGQGFEGGLQALCNNYGLSADYE